MNTAKAGVDSVNIAAKTASKITPKFAKKGLSKLEGVGSNVISGIKNTKAGQWLAAKTDLIINKSREGKSVKTFNAGLDDVEEIKSFADLAKTDSITQIMIIIIFLIFLMIFTWGVNKIGLNQKNCSEIDEVY